MLAGSKRLPGEAVEIAAVRPRPVSPAAGKVICVGLNYKAHIEESQRELPTYPVLFPKYASSLIGPTDDILLPPEATPIGPYVITPDEVDLAGAGIRTILNGEVVQDSDLSYLIFSIPKLIATISEFTTLQPGDVVLTGTPAGIGYRRNPQLFLNDGDTVTVEIDGVGSITNKVTTEASGSGAKQGRRLA